MQRLSIRPMRPVRSPVRVLAVAGALGCLAGAAQAQSTIELFGVAYDVTRLDYSTIEFDNPFFPGFSLVLFEVEGTHYLPGADALVMTTDQLGDQSGPSNALVQVGLVRDGDGRVVDIRFDRVIRFVDEFQDFDLNVSGVTVNTGDQGLGAGGNLVVSSGNERLYGFDLATGALQETTPGCVGEGCGIAIDPPNSDCEDVAYIPTRNELYTVRQEDASLYGIVRFDPQGNPLGEFPVGAAANPAVPGEPKGVTYLPQGGASPFASEAIIVCMDDQGPGLHAFDLDGNELGYEPLTDAAGNPLLDADGFVLQLESLAYDPATGTLFLTNQGDAFTQNFLWVLQPAAGTPCRADIDGDGSLTLFDFLGFQNLFDAGDLRADFDGDGSLTLFDFLTFQNEFDAGC
ncbi:MAG: hypothetical protein KatS3mg103_0630 [Phycisphaerales bacterium]|nr:MAG: hypothetical protein KatS3mg103_0630 [Phycisphaerales bacterium]